MWVRADLPDPAVGTALLLLIQAGTLLLTSLYKSPSHPGQGREAVTMVIFTLANYRHQNYTCTFHVHVCILHGITTTELPIKAGKVRKWQTVLRKDKVMQK